MQITSKTVLGMRFFDFQDDFNKIINAARGKLFLKCEIPVYAN
jgi:hypothetical protein